MATTKKTATKTAKAAPKKVATKCCAKKACASKTCAKKCAKKEQKDEKHKFIIFGLVLTLVLLGSSLGVMTWARYATTVAGTASTTVAKWSAAIKNGDTPLASAFTLTLTPTNTHTQVAENKIAPGSTATGSFTVDYTGTEVSTETTVVFGIPTSLAAQNAEVILKKGDETITCGGTTTKTCTSYMSLSEVANNPVVTYSVVVNWDNHEGYDASADNSTDTTDGGTHGTTTFNVTISAKQSFNHTFGS